MKWVFISTMISLLLFSCSSIDKEDESITGKYILQSESEYSKAVDTLVITAYDKLSGTYIIDHRTGFYRIKEGQLQPKEYKQQRLLAVWNGERRQLQESKKGIVYSFPASGDELLMGTVRYQKIR
ncbi:MAG: hypothetical protein M3342_03425 [Bacteroidota bacterium]|nr:hypothetical protein [Bacteroidota bacterium]